MNFNMRTEEAFALLLLIGSCSGGRYLGQRLGALSELHHGVRGVVHAVDARTLYIDGFQYDGVGPAAYFYVGSSKTPTSTGAIRLRDERGGTSPLRRYRGEGVTISLPDGHSLKDVRWFSVWCDEYSVNFGDVAIPRDTEFPKPAKVGALRGVHGVSSDPVVVVDAQTLLVPNFSYDGEAPDAKFWVGRGETPSPQGIRIPDENGKEAPLRKYDRKTVVLTLPGDLTVFDIGYFAVWCEAFTVNFGHVALPRAVLSNVPPSLNMLGVSPQSRNAALAGIPSAPSAPRPSPARPRQQLVHLDATTYRPKLALAAGPRAAPDQRPAAHEHLHRRAYQSLTRDQTLDQPQSQKDHVDIQPSQEIHYQHEQTQYYEPERHQQYYQQLDPGQQHEKRQQHQNKANEQQQHRQYNHEQQYQQELGQHQAQRDQYRQQTHDARLKSQQDEQQQNQQRQQLLSQQQNDALRQNQYFADQALYERQLYERQLYEQQRLAYEKELGERRRAEEEGPFRYRLVPYAAAGARA